MTLLLFSEFMVLYIFDFKWPRRFGSESPSEVCFNIFMHIPTWKLIITFSVLTILLFLGCTVLIFRSHVYGTTWYITGTTWYMNLYCFVADTEVEECLVSLWCLIASDASGNLRYFNGNYFGLNFDIQFQGFFKK